LGQGDHQFLGGTEGLAKGDQRQSDFFEEVATGGELTVWKSRGTEAAGRDEEMPSIRGDGRKRDASRKAAQGGGGDDP